MKGFLDSPMPAIYQICESSPLIILYIFHFANKKFCKVFFFLFKSFLFYLISIQFFITLKLKKKEKKKRYIRLKFQRKQKKKKNKKKKKKKNKIKNVTYGLNLK